MAIQTLDEMLKDTSKKKKKKQDQQNKPVTQKLQSSIPKINDLLKDDVAPVKTTTSTNKSKDVSPVKKKKDERKWFEKGAFEDGYQFGDVTKTILGTAKDADENFTSGILGMGEKVVDAFAYLAPATNAMNQMQSNPLARFDIKQYNEDKKVAQEFIAKDLYDEKELAKKLPITGLGNMAKMAGVDAEENSVFGDKTDAVIQSGGQLAATAILSPVVPWYVTSGVTSFGSGLESAFNDGASYEAAGGSALISAGAEILSERLGGISFGGKTLTDSMLKPLTGQISNKVLKHLVNFGVEGTAEGMEEVFSSVVSRLGTKLYKEENVGEILGSEEALDEYLESFFGGMVLGGGSSVVGSVTGSKKAGFTENEQKVVDKVVENRIAEQEADGTKLNKREKAKIEEAVKRDLEKGYIDIDTIESVLGGETYEGYKSLNEKEKALQDEIRALESDPKPVAQRRVEAAKEELAKIQNGTEKTDLKNKLSEEVKSLAMSDRLAESYNEKVRKTQAFNADLSQYDEKMQTTVKKAVESGILNNSNRTHEFVDLIAKLSADKGVSFDFTDNENLKKSGFALDGKIINGLVKGNEVILNVDSHKALNSVVGHEITHVLEGTELYAELQTAIKEYATTKGEYDARLKAITALYEGVDGANVEAELTADLIGDYLFTDSDFISKLSTEKPNIFKKIYDEIKYLCKVATAGSKEARQLEKVKRAFEKAYQERTELNPDGETLADDVQYSVSVTDKKTLDFLNEQVERGEYDAEKNPNGGYYVTYKSMSFWGYDENGNAILRSPMAEYVDGELSNAYLVPKDKDDLNWYMATETMDEKTGMPSGLLVKTRLEGRKSDSYLPAIDNQDLIKEDWSNLYFNLKKKIFEKGKWKDSDVPARYNPYEHSSNSMLNDQFTAAYKRDNLVTVKMYVPVSEDGGTYRAKWSKDPTGWTDWKSGIVATKIGAQKDLQRRLYLSRYAAPVEIVPDSEVAKAYKEYLDGTDVAIPDNVVSPSLLSELRKAGVKIEESGKVKYSISDSDGNQLTKEQQEFFKDAKTRNEQGMLKPYYHGTGRADRVGNVFRPDRATSGPMAFFTDSKKIADNYAKDKQDTSIAYDEMYADYYSQFRIEVNGNNLSVVEAWNKLPASKKAEIKSKAQHVTMDDDYENVIYDENQKRGLGGFDNYRINEHKGNYLSALVGEWLEDGTLYGNEEKFIDVLSLVGLNDVQYMNPDARDEKTYQVYLNVTNPFNTTDISEEMVQAFKAAADKADYAPGNLADMWDKRNIEPSKWIERLERDIENGTTHVWTSIPDFVTDTLKEHGYDGIFDEGSKGGGAGHQVVIPFYSEQVKNIDNTNPTTDPDIRHDLVPDKGKTHGNYNVYGKDVRLQKDVAPMPEISESTYQRFSMSEDVEPAENRSYFVDSYAPMTTEQAEDRDNRTSSEHFFLDDISPEVEEQYDGTFAPHNVPADPFFERDIREVGNRSIKAYMYENPEVKPFFQEYANYMLGELYNSSKGERTYNDKLYYDTNGEMGFFGTTRFTSEDIAYLLDEFNYTYKDIEKGLKAIIEDNGKENNAISKRIEFLLDERLRKGYKEFIFNGRIPPNQEYINLLNSKEITQYNDESWNNWLRGLSEEDINTYFRADRNAGETEELQPEYAPIIPETPTEVKEAENVIRKEVTSPKERTNAELEAVQAELDADKQMREESYADFTEIISRLESEYAAKKNKNTKVANDILRRIERTKRLRDTVDADYSKRINDLETKAKRVKEGKPTTRQALHKKIVNSFKSTFASKGLDLDEVFKNAKNLSTFATVDNTPQRVMEKSLGYKEGQILSDLTVNKVAQNETEGIKWLNTYTNRKHGLLAQLSKQYNIKPGSKESAAAQMYAEGFYVNEANEIVKYKDEELAKDFPDPVIRHNIIGLATDSRIRKIYDETLAMLNESRTRNAYPEIPRLDNYFLHFRAMDDTFSKLGLPFNPNDIRAKDLPTDLNGVTADLKPGQPYFASAMHRRGQKTSFDLLGGLERYLASAKNQIYHIDDIQNLRALRNYIADQYGQANGLESLDGLTEEEIQEKIEKVYGAHLSTFAKFLNEEANILAGKTALIDRGLEGIIGRRGITFLNTVNGQVGSNMVGLNVSSALTNVLPVVQTFAKSNKTDFVKAFSQTVSNRIGGLYGKSDGFAEQSSLMIRRAGADRFHRTLWQKLGDPGYALMGAVDSISSELIARTKYNEFIRKGMDSKQAHYETDKWASKLMGDRSLGQMPQLYNSKMLGLVTKFQLEVRNQLDAQFYDTIKEAQASNEDIQNGLEKNAKTAAKVASTFFQLAVAQHVFGVAFESMAGYNPAFDIIEVLMTVFGFDDEEDSEDTVLDNVEEGFLALMEDLPYTSTLTGGRIPISQALPVAELVKGQDEYGNEKSRLKTLGEIAPYYLLPGGYGQIKKTAKGLDMFSDEHPIPGSYTDSSNLRFPVDDTLASRVKAGVFGQYANKNAREYFDRGEAPLKEKQIQEYADLDLPISEYWDYRNGLKKQETLEDKFEYINDLNVSVEQKNIMINNVVDREEKVDMSNYDDFANYEEFDFYTKNTEKYKFLQDNGVSYSEYKMNEYIKERYDTDYSWYKNNPDKVTLAKAITDNVLEYRQYMRDLNNIPADKDANGNPISGSAKEKKAAYIFSLNISEPQQVILYRSQFDSQKDKDYYDQYIIDYLYSGSGLSQYEINTIIKELDMTVNHNGW